MRWVRFTSMENQINTLNNLSSLYYNRQAVLNFYDDEELIKRDGFFFQTVVITEKEIRFIDENSLIAMIDITQFTSFETSKDFKDHFFLQSATSAIEIYFP